MAEWKTQAHRYNQEAGEEEEETVENIPLDVYHKWTDNEAQHTTSPRITVVVSQPQASEQQSRHSDSTDHPQHLGSLEVYDSSVSSNTINCFPPQRKRHRKRPLRPFFTELSVSLNNTKEPIQPYPWDAVSLASFQQQNQNNKSTIDFSHFLQTTFANLLCISFALLSGLDAQRQCFEDSNVVLELADDDNIQNAYDNEDEMDDDQQQDDALQNTCAQVFNHLLPAGLGSLVLMVIIMALLMRGHLSVLLYAVSALCQVYFVSEIMLQPRLLDPESSTTNPYHQSLAAVDHMGQVGDNANLYYLSWFGVSLGITALYQSFFARRSPTKYFQGPWHATRLRYRTGIWTATCIVCCVMIVSSHNWWKMEYYSTVRRRSALAWTTGIVCCIGCAFSMAFHLIGQQQQMSSDEFCTNYISYYEYYQHPKRLPLRSEMFISILLSLFLGTNAVFCTGVQGPAASVGNLYYASWLAFLLCLRICLGCVEEYYHIEEAEDGPDATEPTTDDSDSDQLEKKRVGRVRGHFFLAVFSGVCWASAYDAASNQRVKLSRVQQYMIWAPCSVAVVAFGLFLLCLSKRCYYSVVAKLYVGGILSVVLCGIMLSYLVLTMHSDDSWAVNGIGEIEMANLYYFTWAAMITSGISMTSYVKSLIGINKLDYMSVVWVAICKVCFVIFGAGLHVWRTISDNCEFDEITHGAVTYCSRTILAISVSLTGLLMGGLVVFVRFTIAACPTCCTCVRLQAHIEMLISMFLVLLFVAAVALITGIGGPGQSVGDLYYSTWLAFWVSLGIFASCFNELSKEEARDSKRLPKFGQSLNRDSH